MEKYFIVKNKGLIKTQKDFVEMRRRITDSFNVLCSEFGIETKEFYPTTKSVRIIPTESDLKKFEQFMKNDMETFKKTSAVSKRWDAVCKEKQLETPFTPIYDLAHLIKEFVGGKFYSRMFTVNDVLYGSFKYEIDFILNTNDFEEIKASEFYKIVEDSS